MTLRGVDQEPVSTRRGPTPTARRLVGWHLVVVGTGVAALWAASLPSAFEDGMLTYAGTQAVGNIAVFQVVAEGMMASTALAAGVGVLSRTPQGSSAGARSARQARLLGRQLIGRAAAQPAGRAAGHRRNVSGLGDNHVGRLPGTRALTDDVVP
jgi:hypothetical protein